MKNVASEISRNNPWYIKDQFEMARGPYARIINERKKFIQNEILQHCGFRNQRFRVLDAGCGDGVHLENLCRIDNVEIFALDFNILRLTRAKTVDKKPVIINGDLKTLSFKNNSFDVILLSHVLEHIKDDNAVLGEIYRILKNKGMLILGVPNEGCLVAQIRNKIIQRSILRETDHVNFYTESVLVHKLKSFGFNIIKVKRESFFFPHSRINDLLANSQWGFKLLTILGNVFKTQCAGIYFVCIK